MKRLFRQNPILIFFILILAYESLSGGQFSDPMGWFVIKLITLPAIIIGLSFHEYGHAIVAYKSGDDTPKLQGRVTLNPLAHIDLIGFITLIFIGFGWGKPVQVNPRNFKNMRRDGLLVDLAGVTVNFLLAILFAGIITILNKYQSEFISSRVVSFILIMLTAVVHYNIVLMLFNLLPIPPLDGFGVITEIFNLREKEIYYQIYDKGFVILLLFIMLNLTDKILTPLIEIISKLIFLSIYNQPDLYFFYTQIFL